MICPRFADNLGTYSNPSLMRLKRLRIFVFIKYYEGKPMLILYIIVKGKMIIFVASI